MSSNRTPVNSIEAIFIAYAIGLLTSLAFTAYGKLLERRFGNRR